MGFWDTIKEITKDIFDDAKIEDDRKDKELQQRYGRTDRRGTGGGLLKQAVPNIVGFLLGLAIARGMETDSLILYLFFGFFFAVAGGTVEYTVFKGMELNTAIIRNIIMVIILSLFFIAMAILARF